MKQLSLIAGVLLILAIPSNLWPYEYYIFLRWAIFASSIALAYDYYKNKLTGWVFVLGAIALLFNPVMPFYLDKSSWVGIDLIAAIVFFLSAYSYKKEHV